MDNTSTIERIVMRRVHLIRVLRFVISGGALSMLVSTLALWGIGREVWVARVLQNAPANLLDVPGFYLAAFSHTHVVVQVLTLLVGASFCYLAYEVVRVAAFLTNARRV